MKQFMLIAAIICCMIATPLFAQPPNPVVDVDPSGTSCVNDLEMKLILEQNTFNQVGETVWFPVPTSSTTIDWSWLDNFGYWSTDPGPNQTNYDWAFFTAYIRNCNTPSTGTTGPNCSSGNLDGVTLAAFGVNQDCFEYSSNCGCSSGQEIQCNGAGWGSLGASLAFDDL